MIRTLLPVALLLLAGCGQSRPDQATMAAMARPSAMAMPKVAANGATIPFHGSTLPPGSRVLSVMVEAHEGSGMGTTRIAFESPDAPPRTRDWFLQMLLAHRFKLTAHGANLIGADSDGAPFRLDLAPTPGGGTRGMLTAGAPVVRG